MELPLNVLIANQREFTNLYQSWSKQGIKLESFAKTQRFFLGCPKGYEVVISSSAGSPLRLADLNYKRRSRAPKKWSRPKLWSTGSSLQAKSKIKLSVEEYQYRVNKAANDYIYYKRLGLAPLKGVAEITDIYLNCPDGYKIEHIYPVLESKEVQARLPVVGLFCAANLTYVKLNYQRPYDKFCDKKGYVSIDLISEFGLRWLDIPKKLQRRFAQSGV
jgi:hypothetical protein